MTQVIRVEDGSSSPFESFESSDFNCCRECHNAFAAIFDQMEVEKSEAADREKRLVSKIDQLTRTIKDLSESVISQSRSKQSCSSNGNRNLSNAEGNSMPEVPRGGGRTKKKAGDSSSSRKSSTHIVHDSGEERTTLPCPVPPVGKKQERVSKPATRNSQFLRFEESQDDDSWKTISSKRPAPKKRFFSLEICVLTSQKIACKLSLPNAFPRPLLL